jgi:hypothetical protein
MNAKTPQLPAAAPKPAALRSFALAAGIPLFIICAFYIVRELDLDGITLTATVGLILGAGLIGSIALMRRRAVTGRSESAGEDGATAETLAQQQGGKKQVPTESEYDYLDKLFDDRTSLLKRHRMGNVHYRGLFDD